MASETLEQKGLLMSQPTIPSTAFANTTTVSGQPLTLSRAERLRRERARHQGRYAIVVTLESGKRITWSTRGRIAWCSNLADAQRWLDDSHRSAYVITPGCDHYELYGDPEFFKERGLSYDEVVSHEAVPEDLWTPGVHHPEGWPLERGS